MNRNLLRIAVFADKSFSETTVPVIVYNDRPRVRYPGIFSNTLTFPVTGDGTFVNPGGTVNGASFGSQTLTAGSIASLFGTGLASMQAVAESLPVSTTLGGVTVRLNGIPAPVFFISPLQINFQIPWELEGQPQATVTVTADGFTGAATVNLAGTSPRIFAINQQGSGQGAILIVGTGEVAAPPASIPERTTRPVKRGEFISIYCTGLGPVNNQPATGTAALSNPLSTTATAPVVTVGGVLAAVSFSGLAPGFVGLYQVDVQVLESTPMGTRYPSSSAQAVWSRIPSLSRSNKIPHSETRGAANPPGLNFGRKRTCGESRSRYAPDGSLASGPRLQMLVWLAIAMVIYFGSSRKDSRVRRAHSSAPAMAPTKQD